MSAFSRPTASIQVPEHIRKPLGEIARRRWLVVSGVGALQTAAFGLIVLLGGALLLGNFQQMPRWLRIPVAFTTWAAIAWIGDRCLRPMFRRWSLSRAALHVEQSDPAIQERLSSAVELATERDDRFRGSPALLAHLLQQAEKDAGGIRPQLLVPATRIKRWGICLAPVLLVWLLAFLLHPIPVAAGLYRLFNPMSLGLPANLSKIAVYPGDVTLAQNDDLKVIAKLSKEISDDAATNNHAALVIKYPTGQIVSTPLDAIRPREFETTLTDLQQGFAYMVRTDSADSAWFTAVVNPRPQIASLDVRYDFPAYTRLETKFAAASDGTIEAIVGARVTLTVHATTALVNREGHANQLLIDEGKPTAVSIPLAPVSGNNYQASFVVSGSAQYQIQLCNEFSLTSKDEHLRHIIAHFDQPPTIEILSPHSSETVRPDDTVPIRYLAGDDFGVASIKAIVRIDEKPPQEQVLQLPAGDRRQIKQTYLLDIAALVADSEKAGHITYQLKVTDNRDPDPQSTLSQRQTLIIERGAQSYQQREDEQAAREMHRALQEAIEKLNQAEAKSAALRNDNPNSPMTDQNRDNAQAAEQKLADASKNLQEQAQQQQDTAMAAIARKANDVAEQQIQQAAEDAAKAELAADRPEQRIPDAVAAQDQITRARDLLRQLEQQIEAARERAQAQRDLQKAAQLQALAAKGFAEHPERQAQNEQRQHEAMAKLQQAMQHDASLRDDHAHEVAQRLADLADHIADLQKQQSRQQDQTAKQQELARTQDQAHQLADQQKKLNDQIRQFAEKQKPTLDTAHAQPPNPDQENNIVAALNRNDVDNAAAQMRQQAEQLKQNAQQLQQQADAHDPQQTPDQQAAQQHDQQNAQAAQQQRDQANQAADQLAQEAHQPQQPDANDAAEQHVAAAAKAIEQQADALHPNDQAAQDEAHAAHHDAEQADQDAQSAAHEANHDQAAHDLDKASDELHHAGDELARAAQDTAKSDQAAANAQDQQDAQAAQQQAKQLADQQQALAQAADQQKPAVAHAHENAEPQPQAAAEQQQLADQAKEAAQQADALAQQARQSNDNSIAHRATAAQQQLQQAAGEQQQAAQAEQHGDPPHAAEHQQAAQEELAQAQTALRGLAQSAQADAQQPQANASHAHQDQAHGDEPHPDADQTHSDSKSDHPPSDQGHPDSGHADAAQSNAQNDDPGQSDPSQADASGAQPDPDQAKQQAAMRAQEAAAVQHQASQTNPQAAQEAANALRQAAQANAQAQAMQPHQGQQANAKTTGQEPGKPGAPINVPLPALVSSEGIAAQDGTGGQTPEAVKALGISAGDWARLPALMRKELMNAAQQSGPPTYREMIKNYYVRIAREQAENGPRETEQQ